MNKNNVDTQIEGGLILIKNFQWYLFILFLFTFGFIVTNIIQFISTIISEKVERSLANRLMSKVLLKDSEKILLEIEFNGINKQTIPSLA